MIKIVADNYVAKENKEAFLALAKPLIKASQAEAGNISYGLYEDIKDETHLTFIEEWKDDSAIASHNGSTHFTQTFPELLKLCVKQGNVNLYKEV